MDNLTFLLNSSPIGKTYLYMNILFPLQFICQMKVFSLTVFVDFLLSHLIDKL